MKQTTKFVCSECGYTTVKWLGKCPTCGSWNTFNEEAEIEPSRYAPKAYQKTGTITAPKKLNDIKSNSDERISSGLSELNSVLGGGIVKGSLVLVGGDPGIGKSTLLLQISGILGETRKVLYISGEESDRKSVV